MSFAIVGDGDFHMMFRSIIGDAALVAVDFAERVVVHSRLLVGDGVEQDVAPLVVGFHRSGLTACLVLDACELVLSGLQLDACMVGVVEGLVRTELHADRLRLIRVRERGRIGRVRSGLGLQPSGQIVGDGDLPQSHVGIVVDAARRLADFTHRIGERLGLVAFQLAGGERQRLEADGTILGGVDGLLHVTDISWKRINHPAEVLSVGQTVKVQVIKFNEDNQRISLGMKQLESDPWQNVEERFKVGDVYKGKVTNITDYGAFVELEDGIEGLVHVSEMSWTRKNVHPGKIVSTSQEVEVKVLEVDPEKRRISLGIKQCTPNPWAAYVEEHPVGSVIEGKIKNITEFGLFVGLNDEIDGMIHLSDIAWDKSGEEAVKDYAKGQEIQAKIIDVDVEKERISLGIKQLTEDENATALDGFKKGDTVKATITAIDDKGVDVEVNGVAANIKKADMSKDKAGQDLSQYNVGDELEAKVVSVDKKKGRLGLSVKALEIEEEKKALEEYSNTASTGSALGDALGEALKKK